MRERTHVAGTLAVLALSLGAFVTVRLGGDELAARRALTEGRFDIAVGEIVRFQPLPAEGHREESFEVSGVRFAYSDSRPVPGFHQPEVHGGPLHAGQHVRLSYIEIRGRPVILRAEVMRR